MPTGLGGLISLTFHSMSLPGCKPRGPTHCQQINQPGEPEPACWGATNMDAALLDTCESAQDEDSEGILAQNPPRKALPPGAGCLCQAASPGAETKAGAGSWAGSPAGGLARAQGASCHPATSPGDVGTCPSLLALHVC